MRKLKKIGIPKVTTNCTCKARIYCDLDCNCIQLNLNICPPHNNVKGGAHVFNSFMVLRLEDVVVHVACAKKLQKVEKKCGICVKLGEDTKYRVLQNTSW